MKRRRLSNLLGAVSVAVFDGIAHDAEQRLGRGGQTAAALVLIGHVPNLSIDALARGLQLSHAGTVRLVDRLVEDGLVERRSNEADRRAVQLRLRPDGRAARRAILREREHRLTNVLDQLTLDEQDVLERIAERVLISHIQSERDALRVCRFCDENACTSCPVEKALSA